MIHTYFQYKMNWDFLNFQYYTIGCNIVLPKETHDIEIERSIHSLGTIRPKTCCAELT